MSAAIPNVCPCPSIEVVAVPGAPGSNGSGTAGQNSFDYIQSGGSNQVPAQGSSITVFGLNSSWAGIGQVVFISVPSIAIGAVGYFQVTGLPSPTSYTLLYLGYGSNTYSGQAIPVGSLISPAGAQPNTGFAANTVASVGNSATSVPGSSSFASMAFLTVPESGNFLVQGFIGIFVSGYSPGSSASITVRIYDVTSSTVLSTYSYSTSGVSGATFGSIPYQVPAVVAALVGGHQLAIQASAGSSFTGTLQMQVANLSVLPLPN